MQNTACFRIGRSIPGRYQSLLPLVLVRSYSLQPFRLPLAHSWEPRACTRLECEYTTFDALDTNDMFPSPFRLPFGWYEGLPLLVDPTYMPIFIRAIGARSGFISWLGGFQLGNGGFQSDYSLFVRFHLFWPPRSFDESAMVALFHCEHNLSCLVFRGCTNQYAIHVLEIKYPTCWANAAS
jgi:hypothetical protein